MLWVVIFLPHCPLCLWPACPYRARTSRQTFHLLAGAEISSSVIGPFMISKGQSLQRTHSLAIFFFRSLTKGTRDTHRTGVVNLFEPTLFPINVAVSTKKTFVISTIVKGGTWVLRLTSLFRAFWSCFSQISLTKNPDSHARSCGLFGIKCESQQCPRLGNITFLIEPKTKHWRRLILDSVPQYENWDEFAVRFLRSLIDCRCCMTLARNYLIVSLTKPLGIWSYRKHDLISLLYPG